MNIYTLRKNNKKAFTLIEILITIAVLGILFVVLMANLNKSTDQAKTSGVQTDMHSMQAAIYSVGIEYAEFSDDLNVLAEQLNKSLDSSFNVTVETDVLRTAGTDPWGTPYTIYYSRPENSLGQLEIVSAGPDLKLKTNDDISSFITYNLTEHGSNITVDNKVIETLPSIEEQHVCSFDKQVQTNTYLVSKGDCINHSIYNYSCSCGNKGIETFEGNYETNIHIGNSKLQYTQHSEEQHTVTVICDACGNSTEEDYLESHVVVNNACEKCNQITHGHVYDVDAVNSKYLASEATCTSKAKYYYSCSCGNFEENLNNTFESGGFASHSYSGQVTTPATCTTPGIRTFKCANCTDSYTQPIGTISHNYGKREESQYVKTAATCTQGTLYFYVCNTCQNKSTSYYEANDKLPHSYTVANCTEASYCSNPGCGQLQSDALGHNYQSTITEPNCIESGYTTHVCSRCSDLYVDTYVAALGHAIVQDEAKAPTCIATGLTAGEHCTRCDYKVAQSIVNSLGHDIVQNESKPATCTEAGYIAYESCSRCTYSSGKTVIDALGHAYNSVTTPATCISYQTTKYTCSNCNDSYVTEGSKYGEHNFVDSICTVCGAEEEIYSLSGVWMWHETLDLSNNPGYQKIKYTSNGSSFGSYFINTNQLGYGFAAYYKVATGWANEAWRTVDYGTEEQVVTKEFYEWFVANADEACRHSFDVQTIERTCLKLQENKYKCTLCGYSYSEEVTTSRFGYHTWENGVCVVCGRMQEGGLYDANDNLIMDWDDLVQVYGMDTSEKYSGNTYNQMPCPSYIINNDATLSSAVKLVIPDYITELGNMTFKGCNFKTIVLGKGLRKIGSYAFENCGTTTLQFATDGCLEKIGYYAFESHCLTQLTIPNTVVELSGFGHSDTLSQVDFEKGSKLTIISQAFIGCDLLTSMILPEGLLTIGYDAFWWCGGLEYVYIPNTVTSINSSAFSRCRSLKTIFIPASVENLSSEAFCNTKMECFELDENNLHYTLVDGVLYTKDMSTLVAYPTGKASTTFVVPKEVTTIAKSAFEDSSLKVLKIEDGSQLCNIETYAFQFSNLTTIYLPNTISSIGYEAFRGCSIQNIYFNGTMEEWKNIDKAVQWNIYGVNDGAYVHCTDGNIELVEST